MTAPAEPAGLYIHVPFCSAICPYCDFAVLTGGAEARTRFVDSLVAEMALWAGWAEPIDTIYLGGGTPSLLSSEDLQRILDAAHSSLPIRENARLFLEVNPEDVTPQSVDAWRELGVATVSLGVQSFDAAELRLLGRRHDPERARQATRICLEAGFSTVSLDLIFGLPSQSKKAWLSNLETALRLGPQHISCYQLTIHDGTNFGRRRQRGALAEMPEDGQAELFALTRSVLANAGFSAYEVSNFARAPEHRSRHNRKYWRHVPYLGLGPSAHSFDGRSRWWNLRQLGAYQARIGMGARPVEDSERLGVAEFALETLMFGLRSSEGIDLDAFRQRFGVDLVARNEALVAACIRDGILSLENRRLIPSVEGLAVADGLAARFEIGDAVSAEPTGLSTL